MILVLTPLKVEKDALEAALGDDARDFALRLGGHGKVQFALATQKAILELNPELVICAGACGALDERMKALDVVVATHTVEHDYYLRFEKRPLPQHSGCEKTLAKLRENLPREFQVHFGAVASGDEDVIESARANEIRHKTEALAVAWEGAGGGRAAAFCSKPFLEIRVVTDAADNNAPKDFVHNVKIGMKNIAEVLRRLRD